MKTTEFNRIEPIPGYVLLERIGVGGYGEVWKADAPGGLTKAVKIVYGHDPGRAERELKSLNRIRRVHHPFLLSIERIELIDGNLVIVSELAEGCLKDRFRECRGEGLPGVPRDELLGYLADAADALDYINEEFSLQHMDIKPENLLLVGNHLKVGDFGLLKDLHEDNASILGGLTPTYAAPEIFDGRPNPNTDQYSLAIVYQEMLTGEMPFDGSTAAQLASQHLHSSPRLSSLPRTDRHPVGRALSKSPEKRFPCCRSLIDSLVHPNQCKPLNRQANSPAVPSSEPCEGVAKTKQIDIKIVNPAAAESSATAVLEDLETKVTQLPSPPLDDRESPVRPTLFVGLGNTGGQILRHLRGRLNDRLGPLENVPSLRTLLIDSDVRSLTEATAGDPETALYDRETLAIPLRDPADYRGERNELFQWLSRRWLYNIPQSLQTSGLRPLGRLAFFDHHNAIRESITSALMQITADESIHKSAESTGLELTNDFPRVIVATSISGGIGSGAVIDLAYLIRSLLAEMRLSDEGLFGLLTHSTSNQSNTRDIATANAYACLNEMRHFSDAGSMFPGDPGCKLPAFYEESSTFPHVSFVHLGDELADESWLAATDRMAEYVFQSTVTAAAPFFQQCQRAESEHCPDPLSDRRVRSFGLVQLGDHTRHEIARRAELLCHALVSQWSGTTRHDHPSSQSLSLAQQETLRAEKAAECELHSRIENWVTAIARKNRLELRCLEEDAIAVVAEQIGTDSETYFTSVAQTALQNADPSVYARSTLDTIDSLLGVDDGHEERFVPLQTALDQQLKQVAKKKIHAVVEDFHERLTTPPIRVHQLVRAAVVLRERLSDMEEEAGAAVRRLKSESCQMRDALLEWTPDTSSTRRQQRSEDDFIVQAVHYAELRMQYVTKRAVSRMMRPVHLRCHELSDEFQEVLQKLRHLTSELDKNHGGVPAERGLARGDDPAAHFAMDSLSRRHPELLTALETQLHKTVFREADLSKWLLSCRSEDLARLTSSLRRTARGVLRWALKEANLAYMFMLIQGKAAGDSLPQRWERAVPEWIEQCNRSQRSLLIVPQELRHGKLLEAIRQQSGGDATIVADRGNDVTLCVEMEQLSIDQICRKLVQHRSDLVDIASRIHTRTDVEWTAS